jgi:hypothetical protein
MKTFKYSLDKTSKKYNCPSCNQKRFVKFMDNETNEYLDDHYGRCDREASCGYILTPNNEISFNTKQINHVKPSISFLDFETLSHSLSNYNMNPFVKYLESKIDKELVDIAVNKYKVGTSKFGGGATVFWQIDTKGKIRTGKVMLYDEKTGKRLRIENSINWAHKLMKRTDFNLNQCLFGSHLLNSQTNKVAVVESEKTAIIMSIAIPHITWVATGSLDGFKNELLEVIKPYEVFAFPDKGCYAKWNETATDLNKIGYNISVSKDIEKNGNLLPGDDLADGIDFKHYRMMKKTMLEKKLERLYKTNEAIGYLVEKFELTDQYGNAIRLDQTREGDG